MSFGRFTFSPGYEHVEGGDTASVFVLDARWFDWDIDPTEEELRHHHSVLEVRFMDDTTKRVTVHRVINDCHRVMKLEVTPPQRTVYDAILRPTR